MVGPALTCRPHPIASGEEAALPPEHPHPPNCYRWPCDGAFCACDAHDERDHAHLRFRGRTKEKRKKEEKKKKTTYVGDA